MDASQVIDREMLFGSAAVPQKTVDKLAQEVIAGQWGSGADRKAKLRAAGYNYNAVQAKVNTLLGVAAKPKKSIDQIAREVIAGKWGNDPKRSAALKKAGYDPAKVQARVNQLL